MSRRVTPQELERAGLEVLPRRMREAVASIEGRVGVIEMCDHLRGDIEASPAGTAVGVVCAEHPGRFLCPTCNAQHQDVQHPPTGCAECGSTVKLAPVQADFTFIGAAGDMTVMLLVELGSVCGPHRGLISNV